MKTTKMIKAFFLVGPSAVSAVGFGMAGSASAAVLLIPHHGYPYHMAGVAGESIFEPSGTFEPGISSTHADVLLLALSATLADLHIRFLEYEPTVGGSCNTAGSAKGEVLLRLLAHIGLIDPGRLPGVLMLVPSGFEFECKEIPLIGSESILWRGSFIGRITHPGLSVASTLIGIFFHQTTKGKQEFTTFLLGGQTLTNQHLEEAWNHGTFEEFSLTTIGDWLLHALPAEGTFLLILP